MGLRPTGSVVADALDEPDGLSETFRRCAGVHNNEFIP